MTLGKLSLDELACSPKRQLIKISLKNIGLDLSSRYSSTYRNQGEFASTSPLPYGRGNTPYTHQQPHPTHPQSGSRGFHNSKCVLFAIINISF